MKLNDSQSRHLATSLRVYGFGQVAAFGYAGVKAEHWYVVAVSTLMAIAAECFALLVLKDVEETS